MDRGRRKGKAQGRAQGRETLDDRETLHTDQSPSDSRTTGPDRAGHKFACAHGTNADDGASVNCQNNRHTRDLWRLRTPRATRRASARLGAEEEARRVTRRASGRATEGGVGGASAWVSESVRAAARESKIF